MTFIGGADPGLKGGIAVLSIEGYYIRVIDVYPINLTGRQKMIADGIKLDYAAIELMYDNPDFKRSSTSYAALEAAYGTAYERLLSFCDTPNGVTGVNSTSWKTTLGVPTVLGSYYEKKKTQALWLRNNLATALDTVPYGPCGFDATGLQADDLTTIPDHQMDALGIAVACLINRVEYLPKIETTSAFMQRVFKSE